MRQSAAGTPPLPGRGSAAPCAASAGRQFGFKGGVGMTMEDKVGHFFRRRTATGLLPGAADRPLDRLAGTEAA